MTVIIDAVVVGTAFLFGVLVGSEAQKRILRGHEGTRAEKLHRLRRQRAEHIRRRQIELYGPPLSAVPGPRPARGEDKWWRRHPGGEGPVRSSSDDPRRSL